MSEHLLSVQDLHTSFFTDAAEVQAVNGITFNLDPGEILGIVTYEFQGFANGNGLFTTGG